MESRDWLEEHHGEHGIWTYMEMVFRRLVCVSTHRALGEFIGTYSYQYDAEFASLCVNAKVSFRDSL